MNYLKIYTAGTSTEVATIVIPDPDNGGATRELLQSMAEEETLNFTRYRDIIASKFRYKLDYSYMPSATLEQILTYLAGNYDFYFKSDRWTQTSDYVLVFPAVSEDNASAGVNYLKCTLTLDEGVAR